MLSSDFCRGLVSDDENDQAATDGRLRRPPLHRRQAAGGRAAHRRRRHQRAARGPQGPGRAGQGSTTRWPWPSCSTCPSRGLRRAQRGAARPQLRPPRAAQPAQPAAPVDERTCGARASTGSSYLDGVDEVDAATIERQPLWNDRRDDHGPFDIIGDVHGCFDELAELLGDARLRGRARRHRRPPSRRPAGVLRRRPRRPRARPRRRCCAWSWAWSTTATPCASPATTRPSCCAPCGAATSRSATAWPRRWPSWPRSRRSSPHEVADVHRRPGQPPRARRRQARRRPRRPAGRHAGPRVGRGAVLRPLRRHHRRDRRVRPARPLPVGRGLPGRRPWSSTATRRCPRPTWLNRTICIDTGCVFGGKLTALRYPERELVSVAGRPDVLGAGPPAGRRRAAGRTSTPRAAPTSTSTTSWASASSTTAPDQHGDHPGGERHRRPGGDEPLRRRPPLARLPAADHGAHRPPPSGTGLLEHPAEAFAAFRRDGVDPRGVRGEAHGVAGRGRRVPRRRGGRAPVRRRAGRARRRGRASSSPARAGPSSPTPADEARPARQGAGRRHRAPACGTSWPPTGWSSTPSCCRGRPRPSELLRRQYASVGAAATATLAAEVEVLTAAAARGADVADLLARTGGAARRWPTASSTPTGATAGRSPRSTTCAWRRSRCWPGRARSTPSPTTCGTSTCSAAWPPPTRPRSGPPTAIDRRPRRRRERGRGHRLVGGAHRPRAARAWWSSRSTSCTAARRAWPSRASSAAARSTSASSTGPSTPPRPTSRACARRGLGHKRSLALREFALGIEALERFVAGEPLYRVHECVFGVLALESEPVDPRL